MLNKILVISGPTATGKTALAVKLAKLYNGELISADSRQIYKGLDIGVGKDHPPGTPIHLIDIISPSQYFSVSQFQQLAFTKIKKLWSQHKLPIVIGCSGFYINSVVTPGYSTFSIKPNRLLRLILDRLPISLLQSILKIINAPAFDKLNRSDAGNPRRLVRHIELSLSPKAGSALPLPKFDYLHLSLTAPLSFIYQNIDARVGSRIRLGHLDELRQLVSAYGWSSPALKVSAYSCLKPYLENQSTLDACLARWRFAEHRDARHQKTWFKKFPKDHFVDITKPNFARIASGLVKKWYNSP